MGFLEYELKGTRVLHLQLEKERNKSSCLE